MEFYSTKLFHITTKSTLLLLVAQPRIKISFGVNECLNYDLLMTTARLSVSFMLSNYNSFLKVVSLGFRELALFLTTLRQFGVAKPDCRVLYNVGCKMVCISTILMSGSSCCSRPEAACRKKSVQ